MDTSPEETISAIINTVQHMGKVIVVFPTNSIPAGADNIFYHLMSNNQGGVVFAAKALILGLKIS
ncbi:MAG: hypothetical protein CM1200mP24_07300 [Gammaproteobacteria bacterium]|nr:MAG: hypothetical protein CM1200mP24_07300 [Gammaproteobacteria bacterium]